MNSWVNSCELEFKVDTLIMANNIYIFDSRDVRSIFDVACDSRVVVGPWDGRRRSAPSSDESATTGRRVGLNIEAAERFAHTGPTVAAVRKSIQHA